MKMWIALLVAVFATTGFAADFAFKDISAKVPDGWKVEKGEVSSADGLEHLEFTSDDAEGHDLAAGLAEVKKELAKEVKEYKEVSVEDLQIDGSPAKLIIYTGKAEDKAAKLATFIWIKGKNAYSLTYATTPEKFDAGKATVGPVVGSIKVK